MDPAAQREFIQNHLDADVQFILSESGVNLANQVSIARHYGSLRKFSALGDDRAAIRTACLQDFAIVNDSPESRSQIASIVAAWETAKEYLAKEIELKAEAKVLGQPKVLQIHERQAMLRAVEAVHGTLSDAECPSSDYLSLKAEETETNEPSAAPLDEILSKLASSHSQIQSTVDGAGHIRVTRTKTKSKMPSTTEEYRKVLKVEMYSWLAMAARYKAKHWLHGLTAEPFLKFTEYILGDRVYGIQIPTSDGSLQKIKPDWAIVLAYEQKLRKEAMKRVMEGHTLADSLVAVTKDAELKEAYFTTPVALKYAASDGQPNKWQRFNSKGGSSSFSGKSFNNSPKGKSKGKGKSKSSNQSDPRFKGLNLAWRTPDGGFFLLEHPEDLGLVEGERTPANVTARSPAVAQQGTVSVERQLSKQQAKQVCVGDQLIVVSDDDHEQAAVGEDIQFDLKACCNAGPPIQVEWDQVERGFTDGFGLCSPTRWKPSQRGERRDTNMVKLADDTFQVLEDAVREAIPDVRRAAFELVTGKLVKSPFSELALNKLRDKWFSLLSDKADAAVLDEGQPFYLRALAQWLKVFKDPDVHWLVDEEDSFASGVFVGVGRPLPRSPQVFQKKLKHRKLDDTEFNPLAENYPSAQLSSKELEEKFREEEQLGRMHPSRLGVLRQEFGDRLRVASMAAITKPDGSVRPLHDATHSVMVNHEIVYQDKIMCPGPPEIAAVVREARETTEAAFCVSADIKAAHRLVTIRRADWGLLCCKADSSSETIWVNHCGTFGVSSAPFWWAKLAGLIGRFVGYLFHTRWMMHMIYVDDLHGVFVGPNKFLFLWIWLLAYEMVCTPFGYRKFKGGYASEFVGFHIRYDLAEVGISKKRGDWLVDWIQKAAVNKFVVSARDFMEFLGRLGFVSQLLIWLKPHLAPLYAWASVTAKGTVGRLPQTVIVTLRYILGELQTESYMVSTKRPLVFSGERFRTDAKCANGYVVLGGWEVASRRWFSLKLLPKDAPYLFKPSGESQWASTAAELLASLAALWAFGWLTPGRQRKALEVSLTGGTDNRANEALTAKRSTTKWPLLAANMQLSSSLSKCRLALNLRWRPREENIEADSLTNEDFSHFELKDRVDISYKDMDMAVLDAMVEVWSEFEEIKEKAKGTPRPPKGSTSKKFDKTPW
eukprot:s272_g31.t1